MLGEFGLSCSRFGQAWSLAIDGGELLRQFPSGLLEFGWEMVEIGEVCCRGRSLGSAKLECVGGSFLPLLQTCGMVIFYRNGIYYSYPFSVLLARSRHNLHR